MNLKTVIFDLDGTLIYTSPEYRYLVVGKALDKFGKSAENSVIDDFWFGSEDERTRIITDSCGLDPETQFWPAYRIHDKIKLREEHSRPYEDTDVLEDLNKKGVKTGIVTAAPLEMINLELGMLNHKVNAIVRAQLTSKIEPKPSPQGIEKCLELLNSDKKESGYVGDTKTDMETACNAEVQAIFIDRGEYDFGKIEADLIIHSLYDLRELI